VSGQIELPVLERLVNSRLPSGSRNTTDVLRGLESFRISHEDDRRHVTIVSLYGTICRGGDSVVT